MKKYAITLLASTLVLSSACAPIALFGGAAGTGVTLSKQKTVGSSVDDVNIWSKIKAEFLRFNKEIPGLLTNVSVEVSEGRVLLTGTLDTPEDRLKVLRIVWDQNGVKEVINEIKLSDGGRQSIKQYTEDTWITAQVKTKMLGDKLIHSLNYSVETIDKVVFILGIAKNDEELRHVIDAAESVNGVIKVTAYVRVADKKVKLEAEEIHESALSEAPKNTKAENVEENTIETKESKQSDKVEYINPADEDEVISIGNSED